MEIKVKLPVVIHKDPESDYGVTVPDLPGCYSAGSNVEEALIMAKEAIECHLEGMLLDGEAIPAAQAIEQHQQNPDYRDGFWAIVDVDISKLAVKTRRVNITIPEKLLNKVDMYARNHGESRSGLLAQAVTEYMSSHR